VETEQERLLREALAAVSRGTDPAWRRRALLVIVGLARLQDELDAEDVWDLIEKPREPRALGPIFLVLARRGFLRSLGPTPSASSSHCHPLTRWRSLIRGSTCASDV
jgi:hypothetical protein